MKISQDQMVEMFDEESDKFYEEASTLGLAPGEFPPSIEAQWDGKTVTFFKGQNVMDQGGEDLVAVVYKTSSGLELHILND